MNGEPHRPVPAPYRPAAEVLTRLSQVDFVGVVGPSAAGKTTLIHRAARREQRICPVLNNTSRAPRHDEVEGVDFRFETRERMRARIARREYVQVAPTVFGDLYATAAEDYATDGVAVLPVLADAMPVFRALPFRSVRAVYVLPPSWQTWYQRMTARHVAPQRLRRRLAEAVRSLEYARDEPDLLFVVNDDLAVATGDFVDAVLGSPAVRRSRVAGTATPPRDRVEELLKRADGWLADLSLATGE